MRTKSVFGFATSTEESVRKQWRRETERVDFFNARFAVFTYHDEKFLAQLSFEGCSFDIVVTACKKDQQVLTAWCRRQKEASRFCDAHVAPKLVPASRFASRHGRRNKNWISTITRASSFLIECISAQQSFWSSTASFRCTSNNTWKGSVQCKSYDVLFGNAEDRQSGSPDDRVRIRRLLGRSAMDSRWFQGLKIRTEDAAKGFLVSVIR